MTELAGPTQMPGETGEACRKCGALLAVDQRYCLNCGCRRGGPRVDFHEHLPADDAVATNGSASQPPGPAAGAATVPPPPADERPQRDYAPLAAVGGIAVLGLMLLVGVLIGKGDSGTSSAPPQVVRVQGGGGATAGEAAGTEEEGTVKKAKGAGKKKAEDAGGLLGQGSGPVQASDDALRELEEQSPDEYSENSAKLPDEIATGGAPPPEDGKAPGGGSKGTAIE
jgi:hypothetical protein